jgi:hypothetical protein
MRFGSRSGKEGHPTDDARIQRTAASLPADHGPLPNLTQIHTMQLIAVQSSFENRRVGHRPAIRSETAVSPMTKFTLRSMKYLTQKSSTLEVNCQPTKNNSPWLDGRSSQ